MKLCAQAEICAGGQPVVDKPDGDIWAAVGDAENAWVSVGTRCPERLCRLHRESLGQAPGWGTISGPQPVTGKPTASRYCP